jgi:hypothetical protein
MVTNLASLGHCDNVKAADAVARDALQPVPCRRRHDGVLRIVILDFAPLSIASFRASREHFCSTPITDHFDTDQLFRVLTCAIACRAKAPAN